MKVLITGISGMDGSYLAQILLIRGHEVHGIVRRSSQNNLGLLDTYVLHKNLHLHQGDVLDVANLSSIIKEVKPDQIYNLAAQSHVGTSYEVPAYTLQVTGMGAINVMEAAWSVLGDKVKVYQASSSEMFGATETETQNEYTPLDPISPYAIAKTMAHQMAHIYRERGMFISCGILNNHESVRRGKNFLTTKVIESAVHKQKIKLGNLQATRDWGYAPEYVKGMIALMNLANPMDLVLGTGIGMTVGGFVRKVYEIAGLHWKDYVELDSSLHRPIEAGPLVADSSLAREYIGWNPYFVGDRLIEKLVDDFRSAQSTR